MKVGRAPEHLYNTRDLVIFARAGEEWQTQE